MRRARRSSRDPRRARAAGAADARRPAADALVDNFVGQWLHLRNLDAACPGAERLPDFDDTLREALRRETELFFESVAARGPQRARPADAPTTRSSTSALARHYGIPNVKGSHFRRVHAAGRQSAPRAARARQHPHGDLATRTARRPSCAASGCSRTCSAPPPPPPAERAAARATNDRRLRATMLSMRERLAAAPRESGVRDVPRDDGPARLRARELRRRRPVARRSTSSASRSTPPACCRTARTFDGLAEFRAALLVVGAVPSRTLTEKLLTYALGRGVEPYDMPAVRAIVRDAARARLPLLAVRARHRRAARRFR